MKKATIILLAIIVAIFVQPVFADNYYMQPGYNSDAVIAMINVDSGIASEPYVINPNSKEKHQLNVKIQFNAITYDTMLDIMNQINTSYGIDAINDEKKACSIKFIIDGN